MPEISKIKLPSGYTYDIKDAIARQMISGGVSFIIAWDGASIPVVENIPAGVVVEYNGNNYTGTLSANSAQAGAFYLVKARPVYTHVRGDTAPTFAANKYYSYNSGTDAYTVLTTEPANWSTNYQDYYQLSDSSDVYGEYVPVGTTGSKTWEKIGDTQIDLRDVVTGITTTTDKVLGKDTSFTNSTSSVSFAAHTTDKVLGESTTFTNTSSAVSFSGGTTDKVLGEETTFALTSGSVTHGTPGKDKVLGEQTNFTTTVNTSKTYLGAGSTGTANAITGFGAHTTDTFVKSVSAETNKNLVTTTVPNVTGNSNVSIPNVTGNTSVTIPNVTGNDNVTIPNVTGNSNVTIPNVTENTPATLTLTMGQDNTGSGGVDESETLIISGTGFESGTNIYTASNTKLGTDLSASKVTLGNALTASKVTLGDPLTATNTSLGTNLSASKVTLGTAITVATGATSTTGTGDAVVTGVTIGSSAAAITALGTPTTASVLTGVELTSNESPASGRVQVVTDVTGATTTAGTNDEVDAIISMPTSTVGTAITVGTNDLVDAITSLGTGTAAAQTISVGANDKVTAITALGAGTAAAQTITVGTNDEVDAVITVTPVYGS